MRPIFNFVERGIVTLCFSLEVLAEVREVLNRPKLVQKHPALNRAIVDAFLARHVRIARWISDVPEQYVLTRDPKDSKYINLALAAGARRWVTTDQDLLELTSPASAAGQEFRARFSALTILEPADFQAEFADHGRAEV